jgi:hypothetical protein
VDCCRGNAPDVHSVLVSLPTDEARP